MSEPVAGWCEGGCTYRAVRYRLRPPPLIVHCCHCRWCQRETGAVFALNALIETDRMQVLSGGVELVATPSASGKGQRIAGGPACQSRCGVTTLALVTG
jgi:hypothetical protein